MSLQAMPSRFELRPVTATDLPSLRTAFERLGERSRYRRYGTPLVTAEAALRWVAELDGRRRYALAMLDVRSRQAIGVARYVASEADAAEVAVTVVDAWQGRRVGSRLLDALAAEARRRGVRELRAQVMVDNVAARRLMARLGARRLGVVEWGVVELAASLHGGSPYARLERSTATGGEMSETHPAGEKVTTTGEYVPVDDDGRRTGGPIPLEAGDEFPPLGDSDAGWKRVDAGQA